MATLRTIAVRVFNLEVTTRGDRLHGCVREPDGNTIELVGR